jgi:hypothetical protein
MKPSSQIQLEALLHEIHDIALQVGLIDKPQPLSGMQILGILLRLRDRAMPVNVDRVTEQMLAAAANESDLDRALYPLQCAAGIDSGDVAGVHFSGPRGEIWPKAPVDARLAMLRDYLETERSMNRPEPAEGA